MQFTTTTTTLALLATLTAAITAGDYRGYADGACTLLEAEAFPVVNSCHALPDDSIVVSNQACGVVKVYTDEHCSAGAQAVALETCTDTTAFASLKVDCSGS